MQEELKRALPFFTPSFSFLSQKPVRTVLTGHLDKQEFQFFSSSRATHSTPLVWLNMSTGWITGQA